MIKRRNINMIDVSDWDDLVEKTYERPYSFQQQDGCKDRGIFEMSVPDNADDIENDTIPDEVNGEEMGVSFAAWLARDPNEWNGEEKKQPWTLELFWERNFYPDVQMIANDLHEKGLLEAGEYVINIDW
jgi:hypothetical protein